MDKPNKLDKVLEGFKPIPMKRMLYPRGLNLSEDFINAFHREYDRLMDEGANPKSLVERFGKALKFHQNEERKYHKIDEAEFNRGEVGNYEEIDGKLLTPDEARALRNKKKPTKDDHPKDSKVHKKEHN